MTTGSDFIWRPLTQHGLSPEIVTITHADGAHLFSNKGHQYIDAVSSWWTVTHGHNHPVIQNAILKQTAQLDHVMASGFTHPVAEEFVTELHKFLAPELRYCFFSDSGSTANEVALRMALGYWFHQDQKQRNLILSFDRGYHGATLANASVGGRGAFVTPYEEFLFEVQHLTTPSAGNEDQALDHLKQILRDKGDRIAALMIEPLLLGAAGMITVKTDVIKEIVTFCRQHDILIVFDEVMTGFGRTGTMFAYEQTGIVPDIITLGKGITGGTLPMALTVANRKIYDAFYSTDRSKMLFYSTSYGGNPITCAAALANLQIWRDEPVLERIQTLQSWHSELMPLLAEDDRLENWRVQGTIAAVDFKVTDKGYLSDLAPKLLDYYIKERIVLRPIGQSVYILPPYCITQPDLDLIYDAIQSSLAFLNR